jgi:hypothetical protein
MGPRRLVFAPPDVAHDVVGRLRDLHDGLSRERGVVLSASIPTGTVRRTSVRQTCVR